MIDLVKKLKNFHFGKPEGYYGCLLKNSPHTVAVQTQLEQEFAFNRVPHQKQ